MDQVAVVGPGLMGCGIAQVSAAAGLQVWLLGRDAQSARQGYERLVAGLARQVERGHLDAAAAQSIRDRVQPAQDDACLQDCVGAIESVPEDRQVKRATLQRLEALLPPTAWIATNTSGLPVTGLATALQHPGRFLGLHFFSPVERMRLVEVVVGARTDPAVLALARHFLNRLGREPVVVQDGPGFFTSRVFAAYLDEALAMVGEGVDPAAIESAGLALGRRMGPLAVLDEVSLALNLQQIRQAREDGLPEARCRPLAEPVLAAMVAAGRRGRREGGGFLEAEGGARRPAWTGLAALFPRSAAPPDLPTLASRLRIAEALEALQCLETGVIASADDADTASILGLGFPPDQAGILGWCEQHGLPRLVEQADELASIHGPRFLPGEWLRERARSAQGLAPWRRTTPPRNTHP